MKDLSVIINTFKSLMIDIAKGRVFLEDATIDEGRFRTVFRLSILKDGVVKQDAPIRKGGE